MRDTLTLRQSLGEVLDTISEWKDRLPEDFHSEIDDLEKIIEDCIAIVHGIEAQLVSP